MRAGWLAIALLWLAGCASYPPPYEADDYAADGSGYNGPYDDGYYEDSYDWDRAWHRGHYGAYDVTRSYDPWFSLYWGWDYYGYPPYRPGYSRYDAYWPYYGHGWSAWDYHWWPSYGFSTWSYWNPWYGYGYWPHDGGSGSHPPAHRDSRQALREIPGRGLPASYRPRPAQRAIHAGTPGSSAGSSEVGRSGRARDWIRGPATPSSQRSAPPAGSAAPTWTRPATRQRDNSPRWLPSRSAGPSPAATAPAATRSDSGRSSGWIGHDRAPPSPRSFSSPVPRSAPSAPTRSSSSAAPTVRSMPSARPAARSDDSGRQRDHD